jgi:hypothetical protein
MYALFPAVTGDVFGPKNGSDFWGHADGRKKGRKAYPGLIIRDDLRVLSSVTSCHNSFRSTSLYENTMQKTALGVPGSSWP